jgi:hypothetical protein
MQYGFYSWDAIFEDQRMREADIESPVPLTTVTEIGSERRSTGGVDQPVSASDRCLR